MPHERKKKIVPDLNAGGPLAVFLFASLILILSYAVYGWSPIGASVLFLWAAIAVRSYLLIVPNVPPGLSPEFYIPYYLTYWVGLGASLLALPFLLYLPKSISPENTENMIVTFVKLVLMVLNQLAFALLLSFYPHPEILSLILLIAQITISELIWVHLGTSTLFILGEGVVVVLALFPAIHRIIPFATFASTIV